jgi:hypothetical protein
MVGLTNRGFLAGADRGPHAATVGGAPQPGYGYGYSFLGYGYSFGRAHRLAVLDVTGADQSLASADGTAAGDQHADGDQQVSPSGLLQKLLQKRMF